MQDLFKIWKYREMLWFITLREVKTRYQQTYLGVTWSIITPAAQAFIFFFLFGKVFRVPSDEIPYLLLVFSGFTFWNFLANSISSATFSLTSNSTLVTKIAFPKELLVIGSVIGRLPDLLGAIFVLLILMVIYQIPLSLHMLWALPLFLLEMFLALGIGLLSASINVFFRDISAVISLLLMIWLFSTPVVYPLASLPKELHFIVILNPMTAIMENMRSSLFLSRLPDWPSISISLFITLILTLIGYIVFKRLEKSFADII